MCQHHPQMCGLYKVTFIRTIHYSHTFWFIECFTTTFLHTHDWLNWVDENEVGLKTRPKSLEVWAKCWIHNFTIIWNCRLGNGQVRHSLEGPVRGLNPYPWAPPTRGLLVLSSPQFQGLYSLLCRKGKGSFITDHPPGPIWFPFMTYRASGVYYYPDPPWVPFY